MVLKPSELKKNIPRLSYWLQLDKYQRFHKELPLPATYHFQWQNPILLKDIYPMRLQKLRDFLLFYKEADLWAEYKNKTIASLAADVKAYEAGMTAARAAELKQYADLKKHFLTTAKQLMRRVRDKVPYSSGDQMMLNSGGGWMVQGSPARLMRDYNQLVSSYNSGAKF